MYDIEPMDDRIKRTNILQTGIPEQTGTIDYVFLDPPHEFYPRGHEPEFSPATTQSDTMTKLKSIVRECARVLKPGGRMSIIVEPTVGRFGMIDFPFEVTLLAKALGMIQIGKVYLPRRADTGKAFASVEKMRTPVSECRELLTFEKQKP
jgi:hypothetical protein